MPVAAVMHVIHDPIMFGQRVAEPAMHRDDVVTTTNRLEGDRRAGEAGRAKDQKLHVDPLPAPNPRQAQHGDARMESPIVWHNRGMDSTTTTAAR